MAKKGFSLLESLLSLSIFFLIVLSSLEFFGFSRNIFLKIKAQEETGQAAFSALDKMKADLLQGGAGLRDAIQLGLLEGIAENEGALIILSKEENLIPINDLTAGQTGIQLVSTDELSRGREVCIFDSFKGEVISISSVNKKSIALSSPLNFSFKKEKTNLVLLEKISLFFDRAKQIIRRKVNSSPPQPLLEDATSFDFERASNLVRLRLSLKLLNRVKIYEASVFPKNTALARCR